VLRWTNRCSKIIVFCVYGILEKKCNNNLLYE
jgi:hypothetical protein